MLALCLGIKILILLMTIRKHCSIAYEIITIGNVFARFAQISQNIKFQVEDRLKFYESGDIPKKNIDVMKEAIEEVNQLAVSEKKKKKKHKVLFFI